MLLAASAALAADSVKVTVGHMCCGGCKASATAGIKTVAWADSVAIDGTACTITAKSGEKCDVVSLRDALAIERAVIQAPYFVVRQDDNGRTITSSDADAE